MNKFGPRTTYLRLTEQTMTDNWPISASKIKTHDTCGEQFRLKYVEGLDEIGPDSKYIRRGNAVHEAIEDALTEGSEPDVSEQDLIDQYKLNGGRRGYMLPEEMHEQVISCFGPAARKLSACSEVVGIESKVEFALDVPEIPKPFVGYADLFTGTSIVDWKTGRSEGKGEDENVQGAVYMAGYYEQFGAPPESIDFAYINPDAGDDHPKVVSVEPSDDLYDVMLLKAKRLMSDVDRGEFQADPEDSKCYWCDYEPYCDASPLGAGGIDWEVYP